MRDRAALILTGLFLLALVSTVPALAQTGGGGGGGAIRAGFEVEVVPGDCSGDGMINALDITCVERAILELSPETSGADANADGKVNAQDITQIELIILGVYP